MNISSLVLRLVSYDGNVQTQKQKEEDLYVIWRKSIPTLLKGKVKPTLKLRNFNIQTEIHQQKAK